MIDEERKAKFRVYLLISGILEFVRSSKESRGGCARSESE